MDSDWLSCFCCSSAGKNRSESDSSDAVPLCRYRYGCAVDSDIILYLEWLLELYLYRYHNSYLPWYERALNDAGPQTINV